MQYTYIASFVEDCETLKQIFEKAKSVGLRIVPFETKPQVPLEVILAQKDFALVKKAQDQSVTEEDRFIHPYGSAIGYKLNIKE